MACRLAGREGTPRGEPGRSCRKLSHVGPAFALFPVAWVPHPPLTPENIALCTTKSPLAFTPIVGRAR